MAVSEFKNEIGHRVELENRYGSLAHREFKSLPLRQRFLERPPRGNLYSKPGPWDRVFVCFGARMASPKEAEKLWKTH